MSVTIDAESLIVAKRTTSKSKFTNTLASRLGDMLGEVEALYSRRDKEYTFLGQVAQP